MAVNKTKNVIFLKQSGNYKRLFKSKSSKKKRTSLKVHNLFGYCQLHRPKYLVYVNF